MGVAVGSLDMEFLRRGDRSLATTEGPTMEGLGPGHFVIAFLKGPSYWAALFWIASCKYYNRTFMLVDRANELAKI